MNKKRIFISYSRKDKEFAFRVKDSLERAGFYIWIDGDDIPIDSYWDDEIDIGLESSDIVVGIISPESVTSPNVKNEWAWAIENSTPLVLLNFRSADIPQRYIRLNYSDFIDIHKFDKNIAKLIESLKTKISNQKGAKTNIEMAGGFPNPENFFIPQLENFLAEQNFVGRKSIIEAIEHDKKNQHVSITGILGIGKTSLAKQIASSKNDKFVFWYELRKGLISLSDILNQLAKFIDNGINIKGNILNVIKVADLSHQEKISLILENLNGHEVYIFFDNVHLAEDDESVLSFFEIAKDKLRTGKLFFVGREKPSFVSIVDETKGKVKQIDLLGLSLDEIQSYFKSNNINASEKFIEQVNFRVGGLPLALDLLVQFWDKEKTDKENIDVLLSETEEQIVDVLFRKVFKSLEDEEQKLLVTAGVFNFTFKKEYLVKAYKFIFGSDVSRDTFDMLVDKNLLLSLGNDFFLLHDAIRLLAEEMNQGKVVNKEKFATFLKDNAEDDPFSYLDAGFIYFSIESFTEAAKIFANSIANGLITFSQELSETILNSFSEDMLDDTHWVLVVESKGELELYRRNYKKAELIFEEMLQLSRKIQDKYLISTALKKLGDIRLIHNDIKGKEYYHNSLALKKALNDIAGQVQIYSVLGNLLSIHNRFSDAEKMFEKAQVLVEKLEEKSWRKMFLNIYLGQHYGNQDIWDKAVKFTTNAYELACKMELPYYEAKILYDLGIHKYSQSMYDEAKIDFDKALDIANPYDYWDIEELIYRALGLLFSTSNQYEKAIETFEKAAQILEAIDDKPNLVPICFDIGTFYLRLENEEQAIFYYERGISIFQYLDDQEQIEIFLNNIYELSVNSEDPRQFLRPLKLLKRELQKESPSYKLGRVFGLLGDIYLSILKLERIGFLCKQEEINQYRQIDLFYEEIQVQITMGILLEERNKNGLAIKHNTKAINLAKKTRIFDHLGISYYNRGNSYTKTGLFLLAKKDYKKALKWAKKEKSLLWKEADIYFNLGEVYRREGNIKQAIKFTNKALDYYRKQNDIDSEIQLLNNLGLSYEMLPEPENAQALEIFDEALRKSQEHYRKQDEAKVLISIGNYYYERNDADKSLTYYYRALDSAREADNSSLEEDSILSLGYAHEKLGSFDKIEEDFEKAGQNSIDNGRYQYAIKFMTLAGRLNLHDREFEESAKMFVYALTYAALISVQTLEHFDGQSEHPNIGIEIVEVVDNFILTIDKVIKEDHWTDAKTLYDELIKRMKTTSPWQDGFDWLYKMLEPIEEYLRTKPEEELTDYIAKSWGKRNSWILKLKNKIRVLLFN